MLGFCLLAVMAIAGCAGPRPGTPAVDREEIRRLYADGSQRYLAGDYDEVLRLATRGLALAERAGAADGIADHLNLIHRVYYKRADYPRALQLAERGAAAAAAAGYREGLARNWSSIGSTYFRLGDFRRARDFYERSLALRRDLGHPGDVARALNDLANVLQRTGDYARALALREEALVLWQRAGDLGGVADVLNDIAWIYDDLGDYPRALGYLEQSLALSRQAGLAWGIADGVEHIGQVLARLGRSREAVVRFDEALGLFTALGSREEQARTLRDLAAALHHLGELDAAERRYREALALGERVLGSDHPDVAAMRAGLAEVLAQDGRVAEGKTLGAKALASAEAALGTEHLGVARILTTLASITARDDPEAARPLYERARRMQLQLLRNNAELDDAAQQTLLRAATTSLRGYVGLLATLARSGSAAAREATTDAFVAAEQLRAGAAQVALARAAARLATNDPATAQLIRSQQDLRWRRRAVRDLMSDAYARGETDGRSERSTILAGIELELAAVTRQILSTAPRYANVVAPEPLEPAGVRALLRDDEAVLTYLALEDRLLLWFVRPGQELLYREISVTRDALSAAVARLRRSVDQADNPDLGGGVLTPFDVAGAHALFGILVGPIRADLGGVRHLIVVPDEVLFPLPFATLITSATGPYAALAALADAGRVPGEADLEAYGRLPWFGRDVAISVLPTATTLAGLRRPVPVGTGEPLLGFGDPLFRGRPGRRGGSVIAVRGAEAIAELRALPRLPGTRGELETIARAVGADARTALFLGAEATEATVKRLDREGRLAHARIVAFATHGLTGGELSGLAHPALALTPPERATDEDDGLLSMEEILALHLDRAEWTLLSACNTAAGDASGEALSGLARAFFFAGTRALLVSQWSVDDRATRELVSEVFRRYATERTPLKAEALRHGMLALMARAHGSTAYFAHPFAWAPFFLVGEGR